MRDQLDKNLHVPEICEEFPYVDWSLATPRSPSRPLCLDAYRSHDLASLALFLHPRLTWLHGFAVAIAG